MWISWTVIRPCVHWWRWGVFLCSAGWCPHNFVRLHTLSIYIYTHTYIYIYTYTQDAQGGHGDDSDMTKTKTIYTYTSTLHHSTMPTRWINSLMIQPFQRQQIIGSTQLWFFKRRWPRGPGVLGSSRLELGSARPPAWFQLLRACTGLMRLLALTTAAYFASWPLLSEPAGVDKQPGVCMF